MKIIVISLTLVHTYTARSWSSISWVTSTTEPTISICTPCIRMTIVCACRAFVDICLEKKSFWGRNCYENKFRWRKLAKFCLEVSKTNLSTKKTFCWIYEMFQLFLRSQLNMEQSLSISTFWDSHFLLTLTPALYFDTPYLWEAENFCLFWTHSVHLLS